MPDYPRDLGNGFTDHGVATPISNHRGIVATHDGRGHDLVLVWLFDHRGCYALLELNATQGTHREVPVPFPPGVDCPYSSLLSSRNRLYTHFNSYFCEYDPVAGAFSFHQKTTPQMAMSMTEDDQGRVWSVTYPNSGVVCFEPATRTLRDYGAVHAENWAQYQRSAACDDAGWLYFAIGNTASQIIALEPLSGQATALLPASKRATGTATVYRDLDGRVYAQSLAGRADDWYCLQRGTATPIGRHETRRPKPCITGSQGLVHTAFPSGRQLLVCDLVDGLLRTRAPDGTVVEQRFTYSSDGAHLMGLAAAPDGTICGGTAFPMRFFSYDPARQQWTNRASHGQWNTVAVQGGKYFVGGYIHGYLLEWDPAQPWVPTVKGQANCNPRYLTDCVPHINRPHALLAHPDGRMVILGGTPDYGYTGGGLLFWDRQTQQATLLTHEQCLPQQATCCLLALPDGQVLGASTTDPGTGGERLAKESELFLLDPATRQITWHAVVLAGVRGYSGLALGTDGLVYGLADGTRFFVFDPATRSLRHEEEVRERFGQTNYQQGQRKFVTTPDGTIYLMFQRHLTRVDTATQRLVPVTQSPVTMAVGGDFHDGRLWFGSDSHLYSYILPK